MNLLFATDGSEAAAEAQEVLKTMPLPEGTVLHVLSVVSYGIVPIGLPGVLPGGHPRQMQELHAQAEAAAAQVVCEAAVSLARPGVDLKVALLDRPGLPNYAEPGDLPLSGLIKLRDLPENFWNAETLFVLTPTPGHARGLARIIEEEDWGGEVRVYEDQGEIDRALGTGREEYGLLSVWWD